MCKSAAEGGQRCPSRARALYVEAVDAYQDVLADRDERSGSRHMTREHDAFEALRQARVQYASTPRGEVRLIAMADRHDDDVLREDIRRGIEVRNRNTEVHRQARRAAARTLLARKARERSRANGYTQSWMHTTEVKTAHARFDAFAELAKKDPSLAAPASFSAAAKACGNRAGLSSMGRVAGYALWRTQTTGADFAPPAPEGTSYTPTITGWDDLRAGDVIAEPGTRDPSDVAHEGKVVAGRERGPEGVTVTFTDGTSETRRRSHFTVLRPYSSQDEVALAAYNRLLRVAPQTGRDERGDWALHPASGERVYRP